MQNKCSSVCEFDGSDSCDPPHREIKFIMLQGTLKLQPSVNACGRVRAPVPPLVLSARFGFYKYMKMDEEEDDRPFFFPNPDGN